MLTPIAIKFFSASSIKGRENFPANMTYNDDCASSDSNKVQLFNNYFYSVFYVSDDMPTTESDLQSCSPTLRDIHFSDSDVLNLLTNLGVSKASGIDNFSPKMFKYCALPLLQVICHHFHISLMCSTIPQDWCTHCVIPVYKSGDKPSVCNYRPISLLCILSKVLERLVYNNIIEHLR